MEDNSDQWVVRSDKDQVKGPYTTDVLRKMIISGAFGGTEEVCQYPRGDWQVLTKQPEFYDSLLESLENPAEVDNKRSQKMEAETVISGNQPPPPKKNTNYNTEVPKFDLKEFVEKEIQAEQDLKSRREGEKESKKKQEIEKAKNHKGNQDVAKIKNPPPIPAKTEIIPAQALAPISQGSLTAPDAGDILKDRDKNLELQMVDLKKLQNNEIKKVFPIILLLILLVAAAVYLYLEEEPTTGKGWSLQAPKKTGEQISAQQLKEFKKNAVAAFQSGIPEKVLEAQQELIKAVEGAPRDLESIGLLCMAHEELWPYTKQTEEDLKSILTTTQLARSVNPISNFSDSCQATYLITKGQTKEAKSLIEKTLDNQIDEKFTLGTFLYLMKAEMLEGETNFVNAEAYYDQSSKLWPQWVKARFGLARMYYKQNKMSEARNEFERILKENPDSKIGMYGMGLVELKSSRNIEKAISHFSNGFKIKTKMNKDFHAEALLNYAKILLEKNQSKQALEVAQEGYRLSPSNRDLKEMVISLGGEDRVDGSNSEILLVGDQFARAGDHMTAQAQYKAAFDLDPKNAAAAYKAAKSLWQMNQTRDAINWLDKSIKADEKFLQAYILKSDYESQKYNFAGAQKTLLSALNKFGQNHDIVKSQAILEFRKNNMTYAIQYGEKALRMYDADVELLSMLAQAYIYIYMNGPSVKKDDQDKKNQSKVSAQRYAGRAIDLEPAWPESQITYAKLLAAIDGPVRGEVYLKELIKTYPYTIEYRLALAEFYKQNEKFHDSAKVYEEIVNIDPKNKKANFGLAEAYRVLNKVDLAQQYYNITSTLDHSDVEPMFANAKLLIETASGREAKAKNEQALTKLELVKKINPDFPKVSFFMARCYLELGDYGKSLEMVADEKKRNPNIADSYILAAEIYYRRAQFKECAAEYSAAIKLRPSSAELYVKASVCYRNSDAMDIAEDMLEMAKDRESGYAEIYRELGYISDKKGQPGAAITYFEKYLVLSPNALDRDTVNGEIKRLGGGQ